MAAEIVPSLSLWVCADLVTSRPEVLTERVRAVTAALPVCVWLRPSRETSARVLCDLARSWGAMARANGGALLVGDRVDVALAADADGVHLRTHSVAPNEARRLLATRPESPCRFVSAAVHDGSAVRTRGVHADALVLSPLADVPEKGRALGVAGFAAAVAEAPARHFVALGGVTTPEVARQAALAGAGAIAVRRALLEADDPVQACRALRDAFIATLDRLRGR